MVIHTSQPQAAPTTLFYSSLSTTDGQKAYQHATGDRKTNTGRNGHLVSVENIRGREELASLDLTGFQYGRSSTTMSKDDFGNDEKVKSVYYKEVEEALKKDTGASRIVIFDHTIRRRDPTKTDEGPGSRQPVPMVHVDQTVQSSADRVRANVPDEADSLLGKRFSLVNLWRPIGNPAYDWPLALCDYRSVDVGDGQGGDTFPVALVFPHRVGETLGVCYNGKHQWKYVFGMEPEEYVLIKCFDSRKDVARFSPHTAFDDPNTPPESPYRQSIEVRALVFFDE